MDTTINNLKRCYLEYMHSQCRLRDQPCLNAEVLFKANINLLSRKAKIKIVDHIGRCNSCLNAFMSAREISIQGSIVAEEIVSLLFAKQNKQVLPPFDSGDKLGWNISILQKIALALTPIALFVLINLSFNQNKNGILRNNKRNDIVFQAFKPQIGDRISRQDLYFRWKTSNKMDRFYLEIFDDSLMCIWKSAALFQPSLRPPHSLIQLIVKDKNYFWLIRGRHLDGKYSSSTIGAFSVKD